MSRGKRLDTQGWAIQVSIAEYPLCKKRKHRQRYRLTWYARICNEYDKKQALFDRIIQDNERYAYYPKGRLTHLNDQIERLEFYISDCALEAGG